MTRAATLLALLMFACATRPAAAALAPAALDEVGLSPPSDARVPRNLVFVEASGATIGLDQVLGHRPLVLVLADYRCHELCGPILAVVGEAFKRSGLVAGRDADLVAIGLDPAAGAVDAEAMGVNELGPLARQAHLLSGTPTSVGALEAAIGYRATYDPEAGRYAHPADILVLTPEGAVSRVLPGLALDPVTLRLALVEAGEGRIGTIGDRLHLLCYGLDPAHGVANRAIGIALTAGCTLTLAGLSGFLVMLHRRRLAAGGP